MNYPKSRYGRALRVTERLPDANLSLSELAKLLVSTKALYSDFRYSTKSFFCRSVKFNLKKLL